LAGDLPQLVDRDADVEVVGRVASAGALLAVAHSLVPDVVALDAGLPGLWELGIIDRLLAETSAGVVVRWAGCVPDPPPLLRGLAVGRIETVRGTGVAAKDNQALVNAVRALVATRAL